MKAETFFFFIKKNFGGSFDLYDDYTIYNRNNVSYMFGYDAFFLTFGRVSFDLRGNVTEETIVDFFLSIIDSKTLGSLLVYETQ